MTFFKLPLVKEQAESLLKTLDTQSIVKLKEYFASTTRILPLKDQNTKMNSDYQFQEKLKAYSLLIGTENFNLELDDTLRYLYSLN